MATAKGNVNNAEQSWLSVADPVRNPFEHRSAATACWRSFASCSMQPNCFPAIPRIENDGAGVVWL